MVHAQHIGGPGFFPSRVIKSSFVHFLHSNNFPLWLFIGCHLRNFYAVKPYINEKTFVRTGKFYIADG